MYNIFSGVESMGLIWSMIPEPGQRPGRRIIKKDITTPLTTEIALLRGFLGEPEVLAPQAEVLAQTVSVRFYMAHGVRRKEVAKGRVRGTLFIPKGNSTTQCNWCHDNSVIVKIMNIWTLVKFCFDQRRIKNKTSNKK